MPSLFAFNATLVISDGVEARIGSLSAGREWFKPWRTIAGETLAENHLPEFQVMMQGVFDKRRLLDLLRYFVVFEDSGGGQLVKKIAGYHQFHAVNVAVAGDAARGADPRRKSMSQRRLDATNLETGPVATLAIGASASSGTRKVRVRV